MGSVDFAVGAEKGAPGTVEAGFTGGISGLRLEIFGAPQPVVRWTPNKVDGASSYSKPVGRRYRTTVGPPSGTYRPPPPPEPCPTPGVQKGYGQVFTGEDYESYDYGPYHAWLEDRYGYQWSRDYSHLGPPDAHPRWRARRKDVWVEEKEQSWVPIKEQIRQAHDEIDRSYTYEYKRYLESACRAPPRREYSFLYESPRTASRQALAHDEIDRSYTYEYKRYLESACRATPRREYSFLYESPRTASRQALVDRPAAFLYRPRPRCIVVQGNEAYFTCTVEGRPEPTVEWLKDGEPIKIDGEKYKLTQAQGVCTLYVRECGADDAGTYTAEVGNKLGTSSCSTVLQVAESTEDLWIQPEWCIVGGLVGKPMKKKEKKEEPPKEPEPQKEPEPAPKSESKEPKRTRSLFDEHLRKQFVAKEREEARIEVTFSEDVPDEVVWELMGKAVQESKTKGISFEREGNTFALVIKDATMKDAGEYMCIARDKWGSNKQAFRLTMKKGGVRKLAKPEWFLTPESITVTKGTAAKFYAEVDSAPAPTVDWTHNKKTLQGGGLYTIEHKGRVYKLEIGKVTEREAGDYKVIAHNSMGEISSDFKLTLK